MNKITSWWGKHPVKWRNEVIKSNESHWKSKCAIGFFGVLVAGGALICGDGNHGLETANDVGAITTVVAGFACALKPFVPRMLEDAVVNDAAVRLADGETLDYDAGIEVVSIRGELVLGAAGSHITVPRDVIKLPSGTSQKTAGEAAGTDSGGLDAAEA
ncbi:MAG: hypothetical protein LBM73_00665 [Candidatus Nomurabacteria bacterium]|nr:hypothetical protein [Candidatus Nomurabacteria bacterium]